MFRADHPTLGGGDHVNRSILAVLCALFLFAAVSGPGRAASTVQTPAAVTLAKGTPVYLKLSKPLSSEINEQGDPVHLAVSHAVTVEGYVAVAEGAQAVGIVSHAEPRDYEGKAGTVQFKLVSVAGTNGKSIPLTSSVSSHTGEESETATRAFGLGICPFVLFNKGDAGGYAAGTEFKGYVAEDVTLPTAGLPRAK